MNDNNVIIQALEHCVNDATCDKCPFKNPEHNECKYTANDFNSMVLDFIKHQKARIEMLVEQNVRLNKECDHYIDFASTAIKEFAERLKEQKYYGEDLSGMYGTYVVEIETIDDLVKEMTNQSTMVMDAIDMQPMVNLWIPVEKRLPEDDLPADSDRRSIKVLVCSTKDGKNSIKTMTRSRDKLRDGTMTEWSWGRWRKNVTHWMPLMELPQV